MLLLICGILSIIMTLVVVMGAPFFHYFRRDRKWMKSEHTTSNWFAQ